MTTAIDLIPLVCIHCSSPIPANIDEVAWRCSECGHGVLLNTINGLSSLDLHYSVGIADHQVGRPFWIAKGKVQVSRSSNEFLSGQSEDSQAFWSVSRLFFIPAFECEIDQMIALGLNFLRQPVQLKSGGPVPFLPVVFSPDDVPSLVEYIIVAVEAERKDKVRNIHFDLQLDSPELWVLPPG